MLLPHDQIHYVVLHCPACSRGLTLGMPAVRELAAKFARYDGELWGDMVDTMSEQDLAEVYGGVVPQTGSGIAAQR